MQSAVKLSPQDTEAHSNRVSPQELGRLDEAEGSCRQAIALKPDYADHNNGCRAQKVRQVRPGCSKL